MSKKSHYFEVIVFIWFFVAVLMVGILASVGTLTIVKARQLQLFNNPEAIDNPIEYIEALAHVFYGMNLMLFYACAGMTLVGLAGLYVTLRLRKKLKNVDEI